MADAQAPSPSRDGVQLAWLRREGRQSFALMVGRPDGAEPRVLATALSFQTINRPVWSPDGRLLAYSAGQMFETRNLYVVDVASGRVRQITRFTKSTEGPLAQDWLPDSRHLVVSYYSTPRAQLANDLGVLDIESGDITRLTLNVKGLFFDPSVSSDGARVIATAQVAEREVWKVPLGPDADANGRSAVRLVEASHDPMWIYVTRDGQTLLFNNAQAGSRNLWLLPLSGAMRPRQLTTIPGDAVMHSSLSPDGTRVAFVSTASGNADIWVQHVDGSGLRQVTNDAAADAWPVWSPDGGTIVFSSTSGEARDQSRLVSADGGPPQKFTDGFFRGDWIAAPDGSGTLIATSDGAASVKLLEVETRRVRWEDRGAGPGGMPMFSADGRSISHYFRDAERRDAIAVYDTATGARRVAVRFAEPFQIFFRASWVGNDRAFVVNRNHTTSHIVMLDRFWPATAAAPRP